MGVTEVVRGADLLGSAARQALLCELLGGRAPRYAHHALVVGADGARLAKRASGVALADHRRDGASADTLVASLAEALGLVDEGAPPASPRALLSSFDPSRLAGRKEARVRSAR
jgi:glutamyl-tRNA synthetase